MTPASFFWLPPTVVVVEAVQIREWQGIPIPLRQRRLDAAGLGPGLVPLLRRGRQPVVLQRRLAGRAGIPLRLAGKTPVPARILGAVLAGPAGHDQPGQRRG